MFTITVIKISSINTYTTILATQSYFLLKARKQHSTQFVTLTSLPETYFQVSEIHSIHTVRP